VLWRQLLGRQVVVLLAVRPSPIGFNPARAYTDLILVTCRCSPTCGGECFGPSSAECLNCSSGKGLLNGHCVDVDSSKNTCDQASAGFGPSQGFWLNSAIDACDCKSRLPGRQPLRLSTDTCTH